jgi:hypothetical protein
MITTTTKKLLLNITKNEKIEEASMCAISSINVLIKHLEKANKNIINTEVTPNSDRDNDYMKEYGANSISVNELMKTRAWLCSIAYNCVNK